MNKYTAKLTGNRRIKGISTPLILLIDINPDSQLARDHCWVELTPELDAIRPAGHQKPKLVSFNADLKPYIKRAESQQYTLTNIYNITRIKKQ